MDVLGFGFGEEPGSTRWRELNSVCPPVGTRCLLVPGRGALSLGSLQGLGRVGHYHARDAQAGVRLLREACRVLSEEGLQKVLGPMDGTTWHPYRLALSGGEDWFRGEPRNPPAVVEHFLGAGFAVDQRYTSTITFDLEETYPALERLEGRLAGRVRIRPLDLERFLSELEALHAMSLEAFRDNVYFTPIDRVEFRALYEPMRPLLKPDLVLLAEEGSRLIGFVLAYPDRNRVVLKTLATVPDRRGLGLGTVLTSRIHQAARRLGYGAVIHALMHSSNPSQHVSRGASAGSARLWREYALLRWPA
ncbi:MAG: GNAT family N-acetyltransferase [Candidatus Eremiobacterota bacterium]